jgi:hypothetical protein
MNQKRISSLIESGFFKLFSKMVLVQQFEPHDRSDLAMGRSEERKNIVSVASDMPDDLKEETLLHETIHLISANLMLGLTENQVQGLSIGLYDFLKSNGLIG